MPLFRCGGGDSGSGSTIKVVTGDDGLFGQTVTLSDGVTTLTGQFSAEGRYTFKNVMMTGTLTLASSVGGVAVTESISVPYYGTLEVNFGRDMKTINVFTYESSLIGETVTLTYDTSKIKTAVLNSNGECQFITYNYTGSAKLTASDGEDTAEATFTLGSSETYNIELGFAQIYGATWDGSSSPAWTRTDLAANFSDPVPQMSDGNGGWTVGSSPFDNILPWSGMQIVEDTAAGTLVSIPKYYYKWTKTGDAMTLQVSSRHFRGSNVSPAHADRGDGQGERDVVYVGRYHCADTTFKSTSGVMPQREYSRAQFRTIIHSLGSTYWQFDFAMWWTINMLYLVEFANWNSQEKIGYGCGNNTSVENMGSTDSMTYHTGTNTTNRTTYGHIQYRHIEGLWDNIWYWCDGIYASGGFNIISNPADFSDSTGGTNIGGTSSSNYCIKAWNIPSISGLEWALYPSEAIREDSYSTYVCDRFTKGGVVVQVGYYYKNSVQGGAFYLYNYSSAGQTAQTVGGRLMKLPNNI